MTEAQLSRIAEHLESSPVDERASLPQEEVALRFDLRLLLAEVLRLREWKRKNQGIFRTGYGMRACINGCLEPKEPGGQWYDFLSGHAEPIKHSQGCPDFTPEGELK